MSEPPAVAVVAGGFFSLQDDRLKLGSEGYSPGLLKKIEYAGGSSRSFATASESLERLAEFSISDKHVERLTERLGKERADSRDKAVAAMKGRTLRSSYKQPPAVAVISALQAVGLPVSSALVESLIKQINHRVKGTEQFWNSGGLETVLQVRAAYLSEDDRAETFHEQRPRGSAVGRNRANPFQTAG